MRRARRMVSAISKNRCIPPLPQGINCPYFIGQRIFAVNATYIYPVIGIFPDCYELVLIHSGYPANGKESLPRLHSMAIINPGQPHLAKSNGPARLYNPFFIDAKLINSVAREMGGAGRVTFSNCITELPKELPGLTQLFFQETSSGGLGRELTITSIETMIAVALLRNIPNNQNLNPDSAALDRHSVERVKEYIHQHYQDNINLEQLAQVANYSTYHFIRYFKQATGKTPYDYCMEVKIEKAAELLRDKTLSVTEVCYTCGFTNPSHFSTVFKRKMGVTPSKYQLYS